MRYFANLPGSDGDLSPSGLSKAIDKHLVFNLPILNYELVEMDFKYQELLK